MSPSVNRVRRSVGDLVRSVRFGGDSARLKAHEEMEFWRARAASEGRLGSAHFEHFFTTFFGLDRSFYDGLRILDVGCGPRGSLEWATMATERVGVDPLVSRYRELGIDDQAMTYIDGHAEAVPFPDGYFDVVSSFNSLDHVDDLTATIGEMTRVLAPGGTLLLLTDVNHDPTPTEPISFSWDVVDAFGPELRAVDVRRYEKFEHGVYQSVLAAVPYDEDNATRRYGVLAARLVKSAQA